MKNTISNLTQEEFDTMMAEAKLLKNRESVKAFREILGNYLESKDLMRGKENMLKLFDSLVLDISE